MKKFIVAICLVCSTVVHADILPSLIVSGVKFMFGDSVPESIPVTVTGVGTTPDKAISSGLIRATNQALGVLVVSELSMYQYEVLKEMSIEYSAGVVNSYKVTGCIKKGELFYCNMDMLVSKSGLRRNLEKSAAVNGNSLHAEYITMKNREEQKGKLNLHVLQPRNALTAKIVNLQVLPSKDKFATISVDALVKFNNFNQFIEAQRTTHAIIDSQSFTLKTSAGEYCGQNWYPLYSQPKEEYRINIEVKIPSQELSDIKSVTLVPGCNT